jgi:hypothetical protein
MSQIELRVLKQGLESQKVISASFFTMKDAYRKFEQYTSNLKNFCKLSAIPGFCTRIYTDDSGQEIALVVAEKYPHVSVIHFNCPEFREEVGHIGTFGTIVRFLPLFEKGLDLVWVSDIDIPTEYLDTRHLVNMEKAKANFSFRTFLCYEEKVYGRKYTILAGTIISKITFPKQNLTRFLNKISDLTPVLEQLNKDNSKRNKPPSQIPFGIDELFINSSLYDYLIRHDVRCLVLKDYAGAGRYLRYTGLITTDEINLFGRYFTKPTSDLVPRIKRILSKNIPHVVVEHPCLQEVLDILPKLRNSMFVSYVVTGKELD